MKVVAAVAGVLAYAAVAAFLCLAAIQNPNLSESTQWIWCAVAVGWGPIVAFVFVEFWP